MGVRSVLAMAESEASGDAVEKKSQPQKKYFRQRAHANPLSQWNFDYPMSPDVVPWGDYYPTKCAGVSYADQPKVEMADVGCGYGGLLIGLSTLFPDKLMLGMEIRDKVTEYVAERIKALRVETPGSYQNVSVVRTNSMKYLPRYFGKGQLSKMFFCFPDPHFKRANHRRRIISPALLAEYAYAIREGGMLYTISDVQDLHLWMAGHLEAHPLFERVSDEELASDPAVPIVMTYTEEGKKVERNQGSKHLAVFRRIAGGSKRKREE